MAEETNEQVKINNEVKYVFVGEKSFEILARSYDTFFFLASPRVQNFNRRIKYLQAIKFLP